MWSNAWCLTAEQAPSVDMDKVPREITVKAGKDVEFEIPYKGKSIVPDYCQDFCRAMCYAFTAKYSLLRL